MHILIHTMIKLFRELRTLVIIMISLYTCYSNFWLSVVSTVTIEKANDKIKIEK
jgi:hypothetical protein